MKTNLTRRIVGLLISLSMVLSFAVPFANAEGGVAAETLWTFDSLLEQAQLTADTDLNGLTIHATADKHIDITESNKTIDEQSFSVRAKFIGKCDSGMTYRTMSFLPEYDGTVTVYYAHASGEGEPRTLSVVQGDVQVDDIVDAGVSQAFTTAVTAGTEVFIGSFLHNLNYYGVKYVPGAEAPAVTDEPTATDEPTITDEPEITDEPGETAEPSGDANVVNGLNVVMSDTEWTFDDFVGTDLTNTCFISANNDLRFYGYNKAAIDSHTKDIDGITYTSRLKLAGTGTFAGDASSKVIEFVPGANGTLKVAFAHASSSGGARTLIANQYGTVIASQEVAESGVAVLSTEVIGWESVYIYSEKSGLNVYGISFTATGEYATPDPNATPTPTPAPTATPTPTPIPTPTPVPTPVPTAEPLNLKGVTEDTSWIFADYEDQKDLLKNNIVFDETLMIYGYANITIDGSSKTINDVKYSKRLKMGGGVTLEADGTPSAKAMAFIPETSGTIGIAFAHASGNGDSRALKVVQNGTEILEYPVDAGVATYVDVMVDAGSPVYIYSKDALNFYALYFTAMGVIDPNATPNPEMVAKAQQDADLLTLRSISDYAVYIDLELVKRGANGSTITWESSNEDYIKIEDGLSSGGNYTGVVTRPTSADECDENGGVPVTLTATVTYGAAVVQKVFEVSVRAFNPLYYNDFQADVGQAPDEETGYVGIQDDVVAANGEKFRGIRVSALKNAKSMIDYGFEHEDHDVDKWFDKRIMSTDDKYGIPTDPYGNKPEENFSFYYSMHNGYGGGTTYMPLWIKLADAESSSGYPEGLIVMSMDIYIISNSLEQFNMGIGTSKPAQMCRFSFKKRSFRYGNEGDEIIYKDDSYYAPIGKWVTATIVANTTTHLWDLYFDGILIQRNILFRNAQDYASTIEFTLSRNSTDSKEKFLIDNIWVENITDDYNQSYWDDLMLDIPHDAEKDAYIAGGNFLLYYNGLEGLAGNTYVWRSNNEDLLEVVSESYAIEDLTQFGYTEEEIQAYRDKGANYVTLTVAKPNMEKVPENGTYVTLKGSMEVGEKIYSKNFNIFLTKDGIIGEATDSEKALADIKAIESVEDGSVYTSDIDLEEIGAIYGSEFTWKSSNTSVISNKGEVTRPKTSGSTKVNLTVTATNGEAVETKRFTVYVKGSGKDGAGGGGGGGGGSSSALRVVGTVTDNKEQYETQAYSPEQTSQMIFNDIEIVPWAKEAIESLYNRGIVSGYGNDLFAPNYDVTREQFVKMIVEALSLTSDADTELTFTDVPADAWYAEYIRIAVALGVVTGKDETTFGVGESITRQDMAVMCVRALAAAGITLDGSADLADSDTISDYAKTAVSQMVAAGYITGDENGNFNPLDSATRAQTAVVLYRIIK